MNTTMAPMDQLKEGTLEELRRRRDERDEALLRRSNSGDNNGGGGQGGGGKRGDGNSNSGGGGEDNNNGNSAGSGSGNGNGNSNANAASDSNDDGGNGQNNNNNRNGEGSGNTRHSAGLPPPEAAQFGSPSPSPSFFPTTSLPPSSSPTPTTVAAVSTTAQASSPLTALPAAASSNTFISTFFPITTTAAPSFFPISSSAFSNPPDSSSQPRKGVSDAPDSPLDRDPRTITATTTSSMFFTPESALAESTSSASSSNSTSSSNRHYTPKDRHNPGDLTPTAQHLLIAAGAIGAFIIVIAGVYFVTRLHKIDAFAFFRNRKFKRGGARGWYGWRKEETDYMSDHPPKYSSEYPSEKNIPAQQQIEAFYTSSAIPPMANPSSAAAALARADSGRQEMAREALLSNPAPFATSPATQPVAPPAATENFYFATSPTTQPAATSATENFYGIAAQPNSLSRLPGTQHSHSTVVSLPNPNYNNTGTQNTFLTMDTMRTVQTQDAYDPNQREPNHLSYLSSLSSGFGDGLIIPESTITGGGRQSYRQSKAPGAGRFSWMTANRTSKPPAYGDRDTVYTTSSIESEPRFRTVNSWVAQQAGRVERHQQVPAMPAIPVPLQIGVDHVRKPSDDQAFHQHPGDEIEISRGSRVPSSVLDRKFGAN